MQSLVQLLDQYLAELITLLETDPHPDQVIDQAIGFLSDLRARQPEANIPIATFYRWKASTALYHLRSMYDFVSDYSLLAPYREAMMRVSQCALDVDNFYSISLNPAPKTEN